MCFPWAGYRAHQTGLQAENTGELARLTLGSSRIWLQRIYRLQRDLLLPPSRCWQQAHWLQSLLVTERIYRLQRDLLLPPSQCWQQAHWLQREFTGYRERSAAPTAPVLTAGSLVTEFTGYQLLRYLLLPPSQCWQQTHRLQRNQLFPWAEGNLSQQVHWGQQGHQLQRFASDSQIDRKFFSKLPQPTGYRTDRPGSGLHNHGPVASYQASYRVYWSGL